MSIEDWCDVAWAYILDATPMMANPHEYRETLWTVLYEGSAPTPKTTAPKSKSPRALPRRSGGMTVTDKRKLDDFNAEIRRIQEKRAAQGLPVPELVPTRPAPAS